MSRPSNGAIGASTAGQPPHGELTDATLHAAAVKSRHGPNKGACQILTGGPPVPPGPETDAKARSLFRTQPLGAVETGELPRA